MRALGVLLVIAGCASVPANRYGVDRLRLHGMEAMDEFALRNCLATSERARAGITLGVQEAGACGEPPFDAGHARLDLWARGRQDWPLFDRVALEQDLVRIERWYVARGYHSATITEVSVSPEEAQRRDVLDPDGDAPCERLDDDEGCAVEIDITIDEGEPTLLGAIRVLDDDALSEGLRSRVREAILLEEGEPVDEALYEASKGAIALALAEAGYARARVEGRLYVHRAQRRAEVDFRIDAGPRCRYGEIVVEGAEDLPVAPIIGAAKITEGGRYKFSELREAQRAIFRLGAFSAVVVEPILEDARSTNEGARGPDARRETVDIRVRVTPAKRYRFGFGVGVQSGIVQRGTFEPISVPQWDLHGTIRFEHRNLLGGLRRLVIEERPRMIIQEPFPSFEQPRFGNLLSAELRQPGFLEPRTTLVLGAEHEFGPDPFDTFFRHRVDARILFERFFLDHKLFASVGLHSSTYRVPGGEMTNDGREPPSDSDLMYLEQVLRLDLRDDPNRPHGGFLAQVAVQEAGYFLFSSWDYVRVVPDIRGYIPLPRRITLAMRFALGMYFITDADGDLDDASQDLGPRDLRIRGGGPTGNRGYLAGRLGDGRDGGIRRWDASVELRLPVTSSFGTVVFTDVGDVNRNASFRFDHPQMTVGFGLRYFSVVGAFRADFAFRVRRATVFGEDERFRGPRDDTSVSLGFVRWPGAFHLSIGESF
ncbi:MAG: BamA/TamA family outer membrane protein [Myxococcota bacterium]